LRFCKTGIFPNHKLWLQQIRQGKNAPQTAQTLRLMGNKQNDQLLVRYLINCLSGAKKVGSKALPATLCALCWQDLADYEKNIFVSSLTLCSLTEKKQQQTTT